MINNHSKLYLITLIVISLLSCNSLRTDADIFGNWEGNYNDHELLFAFKTDNTCVLIYFDKQVNKFETISGSFELDFSKKPIALSIRDISQLNHPLYTIIEFITKDSIRISEFSPKWRLRPISFETGKTINLKRIQIPE